MSRSHDALNAIILYSFSSVRDTVGWDRIMMNDKWAISKDNFFWCQYILVRCFHECSGYNVLV